MKVVLADEATADLIGIAEHIARDNPHRALSFVRELRRSCESLGSAPKAFPIVPAFAHLGVRRRVHGAYLIFYRVDHEVTVLHVLHGAMDYEAVLFPGGSTS